MFISPPEFTFCQIVDAELDDEAIVAAEMILDTSEPQMKTRVAKIMVQLSLAGTIRKVIEERRGVSNTTTRVLSINVRIIGTQRSVHSFTLLIGKLSKHHDNFGYRLIAASEDVRAIFNGDFDCTSSVAQITASAGSGCSARYDYV